MPSTSAKQAKFMRAVANSPKFAKKVGVPQSVGKDFEMADKKRKKFSEGGRAERMRDRRMADIEKDYQRAIAKGKSEKEAKAKRDQRIADARDDYAKRTGADRTETRAAEKAAEARLTAARRGVDKDIKPLSVTAEGSKPLATAKVDMPKVETPNVGASSGRQTFSQAFAAARKGGAKTFTWNGKSYTTEMRGERKPAASSNKPSTVRYGADFGAPDIKGRGTADAMVLLSQRGSLPPPPKPKASRPLFGEDAILMGTRSAASRAAKLEELRRAAEAPGASQYAKGRYQTAKESGMYAKGGKVKGYAKGGKIDGIAIRGKTRLKRKK